MMLLEGRVLRSILTVGVVPAAGNRACNANPLAWKQTFWASAESCGFITTVLLKENKLQQQHDNYPCNSVRCMETTTETAGTEPTTQADIITKVKHDHEELEEYFANYKEAFHRGDEGDATKWFHQFVWEISCHSVSEELVLYPLMAAQGPRGKDLAEISRHDHQQTKTILEELEKTTDPGFDQKMDKMMAELRDHIKKEESEDLVYLKETVSASGRERAGKAFSLGKKPHASVPNNRVAPHPRRQAPRHVHFVPARAEA